MIMKKKRNNDISAPIKCSTKSGLLYGGDISDTHAQKLD